MALKCSTCGDNMHYSEIDGKKYAVRCDLEDVYALKQYLTNEVKNIGPNLGFPDFDDRKSLLELKRIIPSETPLSRCLRKTVYIPAEFRTFYSHFLRFLMDTYQKNKKYSFLDSSENPNTFNSDKNYYNYLFMSGDVLRDCYFDKTENSKFKSITDLTIPSLLIYRLGAIESVYMQQKGSMLSELISARSNTGKPTWLLTSKPLTECDEIKTKDSLRVQIQCDFEKIILDSDDMIDEMSNDTHKVEKQNIKKIVSKVDDDDLMDGFHKKLKSNIAR